MCFLSHWNSSQFSSVPIKEILLTPRCILLNWFSSLYDEGVLQLAQGKRQEHTTESTGEGTFNTEIHKFSVEFFLSAWFYSDFVWFEVDEFVVWLKAWSHWQLCWHHGKGVLGFSPRSRNALPHHQCQTLRLIWPGCILIPLLQWTQVGEKSPLCQNQSLHFCQLHAYAVEGFGRVHDAKVPSTVIPASRCRASEALCMVLALSDISPDMRY